MAHTAEYRREWYRKNPEKVAEYNRRWREKNPEKAKAYYREYARQYRATPEGKAARVRANRKSLTGFTQVRWDAALAKQNGLCAICRRAPATEADHAHETKTPRGILCPPCNRGLGQFYDDPARLDAAISYLREWTTNG